jgi:hypothetical protein
MRSKRLCDGALMQVLCSGHYALKKLHHGLSPRANYTDLVTPACQRSDCQLLLIEGATWLA